MATVDNRVVSMEFDNSQFESGARQTLNTIDDLKRALEFSDVSDGFDEISNAASNVRFDGIRDAIEGVTVKFDALQQVAFTVLESMVSKAVDAGERIVNALAITPVMQGFNEYELKMNSIQTILANVNANAKSTAQSASSTLAASAESAAASASSAKKEAQKALKATQKAESKALSAQQDAEMKQYQKSADEELKLLEQTKKQQTEAASDAYDEQLDTLTASQKEETKTIQANYKQQLKDLEKTQNEELTTLRKAHTDKLKMYEDEYMAKVKSIDEERYNELKSIQDQIDALEGLTDAEDKAAKAAAQQTKLTELQRQASVARSARRREQTEKALNDYMNELAIEQAQEERKVQIQSLKDQMDAVNDIYDARVDAARDEYNTQKQTENDIYSDQYDALREVQQAEREQAQELYNEQLDAIKEQYQARKDALKEAYDLERETLLNNYEIQKQNIKDLQAEQKQDIKDRQSDEKAALNERHSDELDAINDVYSTTSTSIGKTQDSAVGAVNAVKKAVKEVTLDEINAALDELNEYADKTIYKFSDMTSNIGKFTTAGVGLEDSVASIKGFSNVAALSGANTAQAARAMYQLSQGIASGVIRLQDWKSLEQSSTAGKAFQNSLIETARVHGIAIDEIIAEEGTLRDSLSRGWLTSDLMVETLKKFTGDLSDEELAQMGYNEEQIKNIQETAQAAMDAATKVRTMSQLMSTMQEAVGSGWAQTFEIIFGNFDEATNLFSGLSDYFGRIIDVQTKARNELLQGWSDAGGRDSIISGIQTLWENVMTIAQTAKATFGQVFDGPTVESLVNFSRNFDKLTKNVKLSFHNLENFSKILSGVFGAVDIVIFGFEKLFDVLSPLLGVFKTVFDVALDIAGGFGEWVYNVDQLLRSDAGFESFIETIKGTVESASEAINTLVESIWNWIKTTFTSPSTAFATDFISSIKTAFTPITNIFKWVLDEVTAFFDGFTIGFESDGNFVSSVVNAISTFMSDLGDMFGNIPGIIKGIAVKIKDGLNSLFSGSNDEVDDGNGDLFDGLKETKNGLDSFIDYLNSGIEGIGKVGLKIVNVLKELFTTAFGDIDLSDIFGGLLVINAGAITSIITSFASFISNITSITKSSSGITEYMKELSIAIAIFSAALLILSKINPDTLATSVGAVMAVTGDLVAAMIGLEGLAGSTLKINSSGLEKTSTSIGKTLTKFAVAMLILSIALTKLSETDPDAMGKGLEAMYLISIDLLACITAMQKASDEADGAKPEGLITFAIAMGLLVAELKWASDTDFTAYESGLKAMLALSGILVGVISTMQAVSSEYKDGSIKGVIKFAIAMGLLVGELKWVGDSDQEQLKAGLSAMTQLAIILGGCVAAIYMASDKANKGSLDGLIGFAIAMGLLVGELKWVGETDVESLIKGIGGMASLGIILVAAVSSIYKASDEADKGSIDGLIKFGISIGLLALSMKGLSTLNWDELAKGIIGIAGAATVMVVSLAALYKVTEGSSSASMVGIATSMLIMAAAMLVLTPALLGLSTLNIGELAMAIAAMAAAFAVLGVAGMALAPIAPVILALSGAVVLLGVGMLGIGAGLVAFAAGLVALAAAGSAVEVFINVVENVIVGVLNAISNSATAIGNTIITIVETICNVALTTAPMVIETFLSLLNQVLDSLVQQAPPIVTKIFDLIITVIGVLTEKVPALVTSIMNFVGAVITAVMNELKKYDIQPLVDALGNFGLITALVALIAGVGQLAGAAMTGLIGIGAVIAELIVVLTAIGAIAQIPGLDWLISEGGDFLQLIGEALGKFVGGIVGGFGEALSNSLPAIGKNLSEFMDNLSGFIDGAGKIGETNVLKGIESLVGVMVLLTGAELVTAVTSFFSGGTSHPLSDFGYELAMFGPLFSLFYLSIKDVKPEVVEGTANAAAALTKMAKGIPNEGGLVAKITGENSLSAFATELAEFGPKFMEYYESIKDMKPDAVKSSAEAAEALTAMAKGVPNEGGLVAKVTGENSLSAFATELKDFGPALAEYATSVKDITRADVDTSVYAAEMVSELAKKLPKHGGLVDVFTGDSTLSQFALELEAFGPAIKGYSDTVVGIKPLAVSASALAGEAVANVVKALPEVGGIKGLLDGDQSLVLFAEELKAFGPAIKEYSDKIDGINPAKVMASGYAGQALAALNDALPETGGIFSWFTGKKDLGDFGDNLQSLGEGMDKYYKSIQNVEPETLSSVTTQVSALVEVARNMEGIDVNNMYLFSDTLTYLANSGINGFIDAFTNCYDSVQKKLQAFVDYCVGEIGTYKEHLKVPGSDAALVLINSFKDALDDPNNSQISGDAIKRFVSSAVTAMSETMKRDDFTKNGKSIVYWTKFGIDDNVEYLTNRVKKLITEDILGTISTTLTRDEIEAFGKRIPDNIHNGIYTYTYLATNQATTMAQSIKACIDNNLTTQSFQDRAKAIIQQGLGDGFWNHKDDADQTIYKVATEIKNEFTNVLNHDAFVSIADDVISGLTDGLNDAAKQQQLDKAASKVGKVVEDSTKKQLEIHSPSKKFERIAEFTIAGFVKGFLGKMKDVSGLGENLSDTVVDPVSLAIQEIAESIDSINSDEFRPTIIPNVDLSNVNAAAGIIDSTFGPLNLGTTYGLAQSAYGGFASSRFGAIPVEDNRDKMLGEKIDKLSDTITDNAKTENYNNFYIQSTDPKKAADEVGYIMQHKVERRKAVWAK